MKRGKLMNIYVDENIKNTIRVFPEQGRYGFHRYDMNENPEGLPKDFVDSVLKEITPEYLSTYPEPDKFLKKYADFIGMEFNNVLATNGSDMAIRYLLETFGEQNKDVVTVSPSFEMYWVNCKILGLRHVPVEYNQDLTIDIDKILDAINSNTRVVVLLNPNNPIGNVYNEEEVLSIVNKAKSNGAIVIIDEAYHYFYDKSFINLVKNHDNVIVLRTFSKLFSIAACRLGVIISCSDIINYVKNAKLTFDVNSIAFLFGERLLDNKEIVNKLINIEREGRKYLLNELVKLGYECKDCNGNFIFIKPKMNAVDLAKKLKEDRKILVHTYSNNLLKEYIRVSTGSKKAMQFFLENFLEMDK